MRRVEVVLGIIVRDEHVLVCRRHDHGAFAGFWEFPGGKRQPGESAHQALERELDEELGVKVQITGSFDPLDFDYPTAHVRLIPLLCSLAIGQPKPLASQEVVWLAYERLGELKFPAANAPLIQQIMTRLRADRRDSQLPH